MIKVTKKGNKAWVTFTLQPEYDAKSASLVGEWSDWQEEKMKQKKNGEFYMTKVLSNSNEYEFRYVINHDEWTNEPQIATIENPYGSSNSILQI